MIAALGLAIAGTASAAPAGHLNSEEWLDLGPAPIPAGDPNLYTQMAPTVGRANAVVIAPDDPNTVYIGASGGGVWRTSDGGAHWTPLLDSAATLAVNVLEMAPDGSLWVGTGSESFAGSGLYRIVNPEGASPSVQGPFDTRVAGTGTSTDPAHPTAFSGMVVTAIAIDPNDAARMFVATRRYGVPFKTPAAEPGLYYTDTATSATPGFSKVSGLPAMTIEGHGVSDAMLSPGSSCALWVTLFGGSAGGIYRVTDGDETIAGCQPQAALSKAFSGDTGYIGVSQNTVYVSTSQAGGTLFKSVAGGEFTQITSISGWDVSYHHGAIAVDPDDPDHVFVGGAHSCFRRASCGPARTLLRSLDGGETFLTADGPYSPRGGIITAYVHPDTTDIDFAPGDRNVVWTTNDGGVYRATDGLTTAVDDNGTPQTGDDLAQVDWVSRNTEGLGITQFYTLAVHPTDPDYTIGGTQDNGAVLNDPAGGRDWAFVGGGDVYNVMIDQSSADTMAVRAYLDCRRFDSTAAMVGLTGGAAVPSCVRTRYGALGPGTPNAAYFGIGGPGLNGGVTDALGNTVFPGRSSAYAVSPADGTKALAGLPVGWLFKSNPTTHAFQQVTVPWGAVPVNSIAIDPSDGDVAYVGLDEYLGGLPHVYRTTNLSAATPTWEAVSAGLPDLPARSLIVDPVNPRYVYLGTDSGIFVATMGPGAPEWAPLGSGLPRGCPVATATYCPPKVAVQRQGAMALVPGKRVLRIGSYSRGMWEIDLLGVAADDFANAAEAPVSADFIEADTTAATLEPEEPNPDPSVGGIGRTVWYTFTGPPSGKVAVDTCTPVAGGINTIVGVYSGPTLGSATLVEGKDEGCAQPGGSLLSAEVTPGQQYHLQIGGRNGAEGPFRFRVWALDVSASPVDFGTVEVGETSSEKTVTFENTGQAPVFVRGEPRITGAGGTDVALAGPGTCDDDLFVDAGDTCAVVVRYAPSAEGALPGAQVELDYQFYSADVYTAKAALTGAGVITRPPADVPPADEEVSSPSLRLGKVVLKGKELKITAAVGCAEACTHTASGKLIVKPRRGSTQSFKLKPASTSSAAGEQAKLKLKLAGGKKQRTKVTRRIKALLTEGAKAAVKISVTSSDETGNSSTQKASAKLQRR